MKYAAALAFSLASLASPAMATDTLVVEDGNAITLCRGARPIYETQLRSRPLAIVNESEQPSFVNCGWRAPTNSYGQEWVAVVLTNVDGPTRTVNCTGVFGTEDDGADYVTKSISVPEGGLATIQWKYQQDNGGDRWKTNSAVQCLLPTGMGIARTPQAYRQK